MNTNGPTPLGWHKFESLYRCPKEYQFSQVRGITIPRIETASAHAIGLMVHVGRARWFKLNFKTDWQSIKDAMQDEAEAQPLPIAIEDQNKALEIVRQYIDHYCTRPTPTVIDAEYLVGPVGFNPCPSRTDNRNCEPREDNERLCKYGDHECEAHTARLDDVSRYPEAGNGLWLGEAKTTWKSPADVIRYYSSNAGQILKQALLWKHAPQGEAKHGPISGIMLEVIVKPRSNGECKFVRHPITITDHQLEWFVESEQAVRDVAKNIAWDTQNVTRIPTSCTRMVAGDILVECPFVRLCKHGKDVAGEYMIDGKFLHQWEPSEGKETAPWL